MRRSDGPQFHGAVTAWQNGATGAGITIGVIDSGLDLQNDELTGRIHPLSTDLVSDRGLVDTSGHGTAVSHVAAAARNGSGVVGIAFDAQILVLKADRVGSCETDDGCAYPTDAIAAGLDRAVEAGARVVNISLGGSPANVRLRQAVDRATRAGLIVVTSAGNDGEDPDEDSANPNPLALGLRASGNGLVIIAGSVGDDREISAFSNRAGTEAASYLAALGDRVCCGYRNGSLFVDENNFVRVFSGTSFAAPQIAGAAALLAQAFPNLNGRQIVDLLLNTAQEAGAAGVDAIYGRGILDIAAAFAPQGATSIAGSTQAVSLNQSMASLSPVMGDAITGAALSGAGAGFGAGAGSGGQLQTIVLDSYNRAFNIDLSATIGTAQMLHRLTQSLAVNSRSAQLSGAGFQLNMALIPDNRGGSLAHPLRQSALGLQQTQLGSLQFAADITTNTQIGMAMDGSAAHLMQLMAPANSRDNEPAFLLASRADQGTGFAVFDTDAMAIRHTLGAIGLTAYAQTGSVATPQPAAREALRHAARFALLGVTADRSIRDISIALGLSILQEDATLLGAQFNPAFAGQGGGSTVFADAEIRYHPTSKWSVSASWRQAASQARIGGFLNQGTAILSNAFALDAQHHGVWRRGDRLALRLSQPLRVATGGLLFNLPTGYDYASQTSQFDQQFLNLAPGGREIDVEMVYAFPISIGQVSANMFYRKDPQNIAAAADDMGIAIRLSTGF